MKKTLIEDLFNISGKVALITGASGGFGKAAAEGLAQAGVKVMLTGRSEDSLKALQAEIQSAGGIVEY
jgi:NADP-dependent 3-hydroxy acid dehydrogenase YdfG